MFTSEQSRYIHVITETTLKTAIKELINEFSYISQMPSLEQHSKNEKSSNVEESEMVNNQNGNEGRTLSVDTLRLGNV